MNGGYSAAPFLLIPKTKDQKPKIKLKMQRLEEKNKTKEEFKKRIYSYVLRLVKFLTALPRDSVTREITSQLMRSGTSIGANYFEARGATSKKDYQNYFAYSLKSSNESKFWLDVLNDSHLAPPALDFELKWLMQETNELSNIFASSILTMKGSI